MTVKELKRQQLEELKIRYYDEILRDTEDRSISYGEIADINEIITDEKIFHEYANYIFTDEDFSPVEEEIEGLENE